MSLKDCLPPLPKTLRSPKFNIHPKVDEIISQMRDGVTQALNQNKSAASALPGRKRKYKSPSHPSLTAAPPFNPNLTRIMDNVSVKRSVNFSYEDIARLENLSRHQLEIQSMLFWLFSTIVKWTKEGGFDPKDPVTFENLIYSVTASLVNSVNITAGLASVLQVKRREGLVAPSYCSLS